MNIPTARGFGWFFANSKGYSVKWDTASLWKAPWKWPNMVAKPGVEPRFFNTSAEIMWGWTEIYWEGSQAVWGSQRVCLSFIKKHGRWRWRDTSVTLRRWVTENITDLNLIQEGAVLGGHDRCSWRHTSWRGSFRVDANCLVQWWAEGASAVGSFPRVIMALRSPRPTKVHSTCMIISASKWWM